MKKIYTVFLTLCMLALFSVTRAQTTYTTILPSTGNGDSWATMIDLSQASSWIGAFPPDNCTNCTYNIQCGYCFISAPEHPGTTGYYGSVGDVPGYGHPGTLPQTMTNCTVNVIAGTYFRINQTIAMNNTSVLVGSDGSTVAGLIVNDQVTLSNGATIRLANSNTFIDVTNPTGETVHGTRTDYYTDDIVASVFYLTTTDKDGYNIVLGPIGEGNSWGITPGADATKNIFLDPYQINCSGTCNEGVINGPAITQFNAAGYPYPNPAFPSAPSSPAGYAYLFAVTTTLPVELVQFSADKNADGTVRIFWSTAQEQNSAYFDVQRSDDQKSWASVGVVPAKGNSSITVNYSLTDKKPLDGITYYRLRMVDLDSKTRFSPIVRVDADGTEGVLSVYNNPFSDAIRIRVNTGSADNLTMVVTDALGKVYVRQTAGIQSGNNYFTLTPANAAAGMYILHIQGSKIDRTVKLVKQ